MAQSAHSAGSIAASNPFTAPVQVVTLNVGGQIFSTSLRTLTRDPDSMLARMFNNAPTIGVTRDAQGHIFIDRDGTHFRLVLNFLRDGVLDPLPTGAARRELLHEADFYQVRRLVDLLSTGTLPARSRDAHTHDARKESHSIGTPPSSGTSASSASDWLRGGAGRDLSTSPPRAPASPPLPPEMDFEFTPHRVSELAFEVFTRGHKEQYDRFKKEFVDGCKAAVLKGKTGFALMKNGWSTELEDMCSALTYEMRQLGFNVNSKRVEASGQHYLEVRMQWMPATPYFYHTTASTFHQVEVLNWPASLLSFL